MAKYNYKSNWPRYVLEWGVLAALIIVITGLAKIVVPSLAEADPERYCPMGGLEALVTFFKRGSLPCSMSTVQIVMGIALAAAVILFSKLFCGYVCPVGTVEDLLAKLRRKLGVKSFSIRNGSVADKALRIIKYVLVFVVFYITATNSELFCKNFDPYYAVATGFKGEITPWMASITVLIVVALGFFIDSFWCRYICPLGAVSNSLKFWVWVLVLFAVWYVADMIGLHLPWTVLLGAFCLMGYLLEILVRKPQFQLMHVYKDEETCCHCGLCTKRCPYGIDIDSCNNGIVRSVDCTLCGECTAACPNKALKIGVAHKAKGGIWKLAPAIITVILVITAIILGRRPEFEIPTINETWGLEKLGPDSTMVPVVDINTLETMEMTGLKSVKCFGSSTAFMNKLMRIPGVHGVKTFVVHHRAIITYDPKKTSPEEIQSEVFVPVRVKTDKRPDPSAVKEVKVVTIRTDKMFDRMDFTYLGLQFRDTDKQIYGLESEFACPLIVRVFLAPDETITEAELRELVERKELHTYNPTTGELVKTIPVDFEFVRMEPGEETITIAEFLNKMFDGFDSGVFNGRYTNEDGEEYVEKRDKHYEGQPQFIYEIANQDYEKPVFKRANAFQYLSNHISKESCEGIISLKMALNKDLVPSIQIRFTEPMTEEKIWEVINENPWKITYARDDVRDVPAKMTFDTPGIVYPYVENTEE